MRSVVIYESMYGNTHLIAGAIADGLRASSEVAVVPVDGADDDLIAGADLVVVGGPTHVHGMSRESTRKAAVEAAEKPDSDLELDPDAEGEGLREWFDALSGATKGTAAAAFDTRMHGPAAITGRASKGIAKRLRALGFEVVVDPESFLVTKENHLEDHEIEHAKEWGARLLAAQ
jgi:flavodoxin-like protein